MIKKLFLGTTLVVSLSFSPLTMAQSHDVTNQQVPNQTSINAENGEKPNCGCLKGKLKSELNLTDAQKEQIKQIKQQARANMKQTHESISAVNKQIHELIKSEKVDTAKLNQLVDQKTSLIAEKIKNKVMVKNQIYNLLTPEQKTKFAQHMEKWGKKYHKFKNKFHSKDKNNNQNDDQDDDNDDELESDLD